MTSRSACRLARERKPSCPSISSISFSDLAGLSRIVRSAADGQAVPYQLDGTIGIDAGRLGQPTFGPTLLFRGELSTRRR